MGQQARVGQQTGTGITGSDYTSCDTNADAPGQEIIDLAAALKNDPQLIFNYVYENIDLEPSIESSKGALGTYLDQSGSSFDQSSLLVALLRAASAKNAAIGKVQFEIGTATLTASQMGLVALPAQLGINAGATSATIPYAWVSAVIGGTATTYNPAGKTYYVLNGAGVSQYGGAAPSPNLASVSSYLQTFAQNIYSQAGQNNSSVIDFIGGRRINTTAAPLNNMAGGTAYDSMPAGYRTVVQFLISYSDYAGYCTDQVYGHMVIANQGTIWIDNASFFTYTQGAQQTLTVGITHQSIVNGTQTNWWQPATITLEWQGWDVFNVGIGRYGRFHATRDAGLAARTGAAGPVGVGNSVLALMSTSSGQLSQTSHATELLDQLAGTYTQTKHMLQITTNNETINTPLISTTVTAITSTPASGLRVGTGAVAYALSAIQSAQEAVALQGSGVTGATSAAALIGAASSSSGLQFIQHTQSPPAVPGYNSAEQNIIASYLYYGYDVCLPVTPPAWNASGRAAPFLALQANGTSAFVLATPDGLLYKGAATPTPPDPSVFADNAAASAGQSSAEGARGRGLAVDPGTGDVTFSAPLLSIGPKGSPYALEFDVSYSSATAAQQGTGSSDGLGWSHNYEMSVTPASDGYAMLGSDLVGPAAPGIVALYELLQTSDAIAKSYAGGPPLTTSTLFIEAASAGWFVQQATNDVVTFKAGAAQQVFAHMPDGTYRPANPSAARLTIPTPQIGAYRIATGDGTTLQFDPTSGLITSSTDAGGNIVNYTYTTSGTFSLLHTVASTYHTLTFSYNTPPQGMSPKLSSVKDEHGRTVNLFYTNGQGLTGYYNGVLNSIALVDSTQAQPRNLSFTYNNTTIQFANSSVYLLPAGDSVFHSELASVADPLNHASAVGFDSRVFPISVKDALSNTTSYFLAGSRNEVDDAMGNISYTHSFPLALIKASVETDIWDGLGKETTAQYNDVGQLVSKVLPDTQAGYQTSYTYDPNGNLASTTIGAITSSATYNSCNKPVTTTDALNRTTHYTYNAGTSLPCFVSQIIHPTVDGTNNTSAPTETFSYGTGVRLKEVQTADGENTYYNFTNEILTSVVRDYSNLKLTTTFGYDSVGNVNSVQNARLNTTTLQYDLARRVIQKTTPPISQNGNTQYNTYYKYDADGRLLETDQDSGTPGNPLVSTSTYDYAGNKKTDTAPTTSTTVVHTTAYTYDADNRLSTVQDPAAQTITKTYDKDSRLYQVLDGYGNASQTYSYTGDGLVSSLTTGTTAYGATNVIAYTYDPYDRLTTTTYNDASYEKTVPDNGGRILSRRNRAGVTINYTYDNLDRLSTETDPGVSTPISFTYDLVNRPLTVTDQSGTFTYQYDTAGRQKQVTHPDGKIIKHSYDADDDVATITYPDNYVYTYLSNELDQMTDVQETPSGTQYPNELIHYGYDTLSRRSTLSDRPNTVTTYGYDAFNGLTSIALTFNPPSAGNITWSYTRDKNERRQTDAVSMGNLWHPAAADRTTYQANGLNQYSSINFVNLGYDATGNLKTDPTAPLGSASYTWDLKNRLTGASNSQHVSSYTYDAFSERTSSTIDGAATIHVTDGGRLLADYTNNGTEVAHYVYGLDNAPVRFEYFGGNAQVQSAKYYHTDALGSVAYATDDTGAPIEGWSYSAFGESRISATTFRYAGMPLDHETSLYYDHARYYSPEQGRFISPDPIGVEGGMDIYAYAGNDPLNGVDTSGLDEDPFCIGTCGGGGGGGSGGGGYATVVTGVGQDTGNVYFSYTINDNGAAADAAAAAGGVVGSIPAGAYGIGPTPSGNVGYSLDGGSSGDTSTVIGGIVRTGIEGQPYQVAEGPDTVPGLGAELDAGAQEFQQGMKAVGEADQQLSGLQAATMEANIEGAIQTSQFTGGKLVQITGGPTSVANPDPSLGADQVRYYVDFSDEFGKITNYSVNYDPATGEVGIVKPSSGPR